MSLLRELGYRRVRHYAGGLAEWVEADGPVEGEDAGASHPAAAPAPLAAPPAARPPDGFLSRRHQWGNRLLEVIERRSTTELFLLWLLMVLACGALYWVAALLGHQGLVAAGVPLPMSPRGLLTAVYFSFVTATSVGYGDVVPMGASRVLAVAEAVAGLLAFGAVVSKFVSRRQDELVREIHRVTFEERLDRVQTNLHLVLSELQAVAAMCEEGAARPERVLVRLESAALVFSGELRAVHDLLYRPQQMPNEAVLEGILASLATSLREFAELLACLPGAGVVRSPTLDAARRRIARLAEEICGECVPRTYAPTLTGWMDRVQQAARRLH